MCALLRKSALKIAKSIFAVHFEKSNYFFIFLSIVLFNNVIVFHFWIQPCVTWGYFWLLTLIYMGLFLNTTTQKNIEDLFRFCGFSFSHEWESPSFEPDLSLFGARSHFLWSWGCIGLYLVLVFFPLLLVILSNKQKLNQPVCHWFDFWV